MPTGDDEKCPIEDIMVWLKNSREYTVNNATEFVKKIFERPEKWDVVNAHINGFLLSQTEKDLIPNWILK